jgi:stearoyl-CoA desaturase (Delta-9 desaturase)
VVRAFRTEMTVAEVQASAVPVKRTEPQIWWSNAFFFCAIHALAMLGVWYRPPSMVPRQTLWLAFTFWQLSTFGYAPFQPEAASISHVNPCSITIGYHRLYSHRSFRASFWVRLVLAACGTLGFQGSVKVRAYVTSRPKYLPDHLASGGKYLDVWSFLKW